MYVRRHMFHALMPPRRSRALPARPALLLLLLLGAQPVASAAPDCGWREPPRTYPEGVRWTCAAIGWPDGDTLKARCEGKAEPVTIRLRGAATEERGEGRWRQAREELRRRTTNRALDVLPPHRSHRRVVADVLAGGVNLGAAMDAAGSSKEDCPKR